VADEVSEAQVGWDNFWADRWEVSCFFSVLVDFFVSGNADVPKSPDENNCLIDDGKQGE